MALKAGRVGVNRNQVDEFGNIKGSVTPENVYTKTQCDNKFETKTHANNTFQNKNIELPLHLLNGSQLTVESGLHALEESIGDVQFRVSNNKLQYRLNGTGEWNDVGSNGVVYVEDIETEIGTFGNKTLYQRICRYVITSGSTYVDTDYDFSSVDDMILLTSTAQSTNDLNGMLINPIFYGSGGEFFRSGIFRGKLRLNFGDAPSKPLKVITLAQYTKATV